MGCGMTDSNRRRKLSKEEIKDKIKHLEDDIKFSEKEIKGLKSLT